MSVETSGLRGWYSRYIGEPIVLPLLANFESMAGSSYRSHDQYVQIGKKEENGVAQEEKKSGFRTAFQAKVKKFFTSKADQEDGWMGKVSSWFFKKKADFYKRHEEIKKSNASFKKAPQ
jgi:hypothetical protein